MTEMLQLIVIQKSNFHPQVKHCQIVIYKIKGISFISLKLSNRYIAISEKPRQINVICGKEHQAITIENNLLLYASETCDLLYNHQHMRIGEEKTNITYKTNLNTIALPLNDGLEEILTKTENTPKITNNVQSYRMHLNHISDEINSLNYKHRIRSLKKRELSALQSISYIALALLGIYMSEMEGHWNLPFGTLGKIRNTVI